MPDKELADHSAETPDAAAALGTLASLQPDDVAKTITVRGEAHSVPLAMHRSLAHCGYHVGQIVMTARILASNEWETITIPRGASASYNQTVWGKGHYRPQ